MDENSEIVSLKNRSKNTRFLRICCVLLLIGFITTLTLTLVYTIDPWRRPRQQDENTYGYQRLNLQRPVDHFVSGLNNSSAPFTYVVFSDPQLGLYDVVKGNLGLDWQYDIDNVRKFTDVINAMQTKPDFVFCAGDLNNAYPENDPSAQKLGFLSPYRPAQTNDLLQTLRKYFANSIPLFVIAGNHDLTENAKFKHVDGYEKVWGQGYFYFWNSGRIFIALETQFFRSEQAETVNLRNKQVEWLQKLFKTLPKGAPKTVFQHVALFIRQSNETDSEKAGKALPKQHRDTLLQMFCENNVNLVISGHTHFTSLPKPYKCGSGGNNRVRQIVLTSLTAQLKWKSDSRFYPIGKPGYMIANVDAKGQTAVQVVNLKD